ncbi:MAG: hypothetical protein ACI92Z_003009 [Paracoccaceae bacterium]|jgi:hypothetical protein
MRYSAASLSQLVSTLSGSLPHLGLIYAFIWPIAQPARVKQNRFKGIADKTGASLHQ